MADKYGTVKTYEVVKVINSQKAATDAGGGGRTRQPWDRQPVGPPGDGDDVTILHWLLHTIEDELNRFVFHRGGQAAKVWRTDCQKVWPTVTHCFANAHHTLDRGSRSTTRKSAVAGLTGDMLKIKTGRLWNGLNVFRSYMGELSIVDPQPPPERPILQKARDWVFEAINGILGSLKFVFHGLEFVKEYKEHIELSIKGVELGMVR
jgi:hypothetical protein